MPKVGSVPIRPIHFHLMNVGYLEAVIEI